MATTTTSPDVEATIAPVGEVPAWPHAQCGTRFSTGDSAQIDSPRIPSQRDALQALLAFSAMHEQVRRRRALAVRHRNFDGSVVVAEFETAELFVLDEVLQLVAERAVAITGADGVAIALAENNEIVLRAAAGVVRPDVGARIDRDSAFSGACFRTAEIINSDDTETDPRVNLQACRKLGARSMIAVPLCGRHRVIGVLEAFSTEPFGFNDIDIGSLSLLAELVVGALKPEDEDRFAQSAQVAEKKLDATKPVATEQEVVQALTTQPETSESNPVVAAPVVSSPVITAPVIAVPTIPPETTATAPTEIARAKAADAGLASAASKSTLGEHAVESLAASQEPLQSQTTSTAETAEPLLTFGQIESESAKHRPVVLVLLVFIVIAAAFAGGVWWKLKTAQLGSVIVKTGNPRIERTEPKLVPPKQDATVPPAPSPSVNPLTAGQGAESALDDASEPDNSLETPQEVSKFPRVTGIRHWSSADSSTVVLDLEDQVQYEEHQLSNPDRYYYDLRDTQLAPELAGKSIDVGDSFLTRIRVAQPTAGMTRVVLETKSGAYLAHPRVSLEPNPYRLVIQVSKAGANPQGAVNLFPNAQAEKNKLAIVVPPPTKEDLQLRARVPKMRIVVDAGHGGWDLGTVGRRGLLEKDLVLEIAQRLGKLLESRLGSEVILTRNDDSYIPLDERAEMANQAQADLFISVHANYSDLPSARGVETYYTNFFSAPNSKDAAAHANSSARNSATTSLSPADLHERIEQSRRLAASVQRSLYGTLSVQNPGLRDRGIKEAGFVVLTESAMPGILAEVSFVSSPTDEQKLRSDGYREEIAEALYRGIAHYAANSRAVKVAAK
jgi:N-acetylmuramoyl-L-alanine amidase/putative methionine-R-sulfoxide reductase with GAF domain